MRPASGLEEERLEEPLLADPRDADGEAIPNIFCANPGCLTSARSKDLSAPHEAADGGDTCPPSQHIHDRNISHDLENPQDAPDSFPVAIVEAIKSGDLDRTEEAFASARHLELDNLRDAVGKDILGIALENGSYALARLVLKKLSKKIASVQETTKILSENIESLNQQFPELFIEFFLENNVFCIELGRVSVPHKSFASQDFIVGTLDKQPSSWEISAVESEDLCSYVHPRKHAAVGSRKMVNAALKLVPIEDIAKSAKSDIVRSLLVSKTQANVFGSELVEWVIHWKWNKVWRFWFWTLAMLHAILIASFSAFVILHTLRICSNKSIADLPPVSPMEAISLKASCAVIGIFLMQELLLLVKSCWNYGKNGMLYWLSSPWKWAKVGSGVFMAVYCSLLFLGHADSHVGKSILASEYILIWIAVFYYLQPFRWIGPLVATIRKVIFEVFLLLEGIMLHTLLFAVMNNGYRVQEYEDEELNRCRAMVINDCETTFSILPNCLKKRMERKTKKYLYVLTPVKENGLNKPRSSRRTPSLQIEELQEAQNKMQAMLKDLQSVVIRIPDHLSSSLRGVSDGAGHSDHSFQRGQNSDKEIVRSNLHREFSVTRGDLPEH